MGPQGPGSPAEGREDHLGLRGPHQSTGPHPPALSAGTGEEGRGYSEGESRDLQESVC